MDYITRLYRSKAEQLQEQVNFLEAQLQHLAEFRGDDVNFSGTGQGQQTVSDEQLKDQMHRHKRSGFFGAEVADDKQSQEYRDAKAELDRRSKPKPDTQSQIVIDTRPKAPAAPAPAKKAAPPKKAAPAPVPVQDEPIAPPANASPRVQATDAAGNPSNTPEARGQLQKDAMNPSGAYTPTPKTNERRNRENAQRQGVWNDGVDHGSARPPEPTKAQKEFEVSTQQPTTGVGPDGETLPQAEKRVANEKANARAMAQQFTPQGMYKALKKITTPTYSPVPKPMSDNPDFGNGTPDAQRGQHSMDPETWMGKGTDQDPMKYVPKEVSTKDDRPTSGRTPNYPTSTYDLLKKYGVK